ncbi:MAG: pyrrolo-quinoline quinone [Alphaproteobacteria bacterium]|nr:pyrrolo-quinoline quinone [Alphaproteobacteria bacterium]
MTSKLKLNSALTLAASTAIFLSGCDSFKEKVILSGKRETILAIDSSLQSDPAIAHSPVNLPSPSKNEDWAQAGGNPSHVMPNVVLAKTLNKTWSTSIGSGVSDDHRMTSGPVIGGGRIFVSDAVGLISAIDVKSGAIVWSVDPLPEGHGSEAMGGGVSFHNGTLYCTTSHGELLALNAQDGKILWRKSLGAPSRVAPTIKGDIVYALTINNETHAITTSTGNELWSHAGISEAAGILGGASPAAEGNTVIAAYSSGEVFAFQATNGQPLWGDLLNPALRIDSVASIAHIRARPAISGGVVYVISHGGQMVAQDLKTGSRLWQREIGAIRSPAVIGDSIFIMTNDTDLVCVKKRTGQIHWAVPLPKLDDNKKPILWAGPIVADDSLILTSSNGKLLFASPQNGKTLKTLEIGDSSSLSPIVAGGALYVLTDNAQLIKFSSEEQKS